jgi:hypothetical protein
MFEHRRVSDDRHEEHSNIAKYIFVVAAPNLYSAVASCLVENINQADDGASQACVVSQNEDMSNHLGGHGSSLDQYSEWVTKK